MFGLNDSHRVGNKVQVSDSVGLNFVCKVGICTAFIQGKSL